MAAFTSLLGKRVEVDYRAGEVQMTVTGKLALDSGQLVRIEDRFSQTGREKTVRIEIPYSAIVRIREITREREPSSVS